VNVHGVNGVGQTEMHTAEPLVLEPYSFKDEIAIQTLKRCNSPGTDRIPAELFQAGCNTLHTESPQTYYFYLEQGRIATVVAGIYYCTYL
jgi:hypothetical protein